MFGASVQRPARRKAIVGVHVCLRTSSTPPSPPGFVGQILRKSQKCIGVQSSSSAMRARAHRDEQTRRRRIVTWRRAPDLVRLRARHLATALAAATRSSERVAARGAPAPPHSRPHAAGRPRVVGGRAGKRAAADSSCRRARARVGRGQHARRTGSPWGAASDVENSKLIETSPNTCLSLGVNPWIWFC